MLCVLLILVAEKVQTEAKQRHQGLDTKRSWARKMLLYMLTGVPWQEKQERGDLRKNKYYDVSMNRMIEKKKKKLFSSEKAYSRH